MSPKHERKDFNLVLQLVGVFHITNDLCFKPFLKQKYMEDALPG